MIRLNKSNRLITILINESLLYQTKWSIDGKKKKKLKRNYAYTTNSSTPYINRIVRIKNYFADPLNTITAADFFRFFLVAYLLN